MVCTLHTHTDEDNPHLLQLHSSLALSTARNARPQPVTHHKLVSHTMKQRLAPAASQPSLQISHIPPGAGSMPIQLEGQDWMVMTGCRYVAYGNASIPDCTQVCILIAVWSPTDLGAEHLGIPVSAAGIHPDLTLQTAPGAGL